MKSDVPLSIIVDRTSFDNSKNYSLLRHKSLTLLEG